MANNRIHVDDGCCYTDYRFSAPTVYNSRNVHIGDDTVFDWDVACSIVAELSDAARRAGRAS